MFNFGRRARDDKQLGVSEGESNFGNLSSSGVELFRSVFKLDRERPIYVVLCVTFATRVSKWSPPDSVKFK